MFLNINLYTLVIFVVSANSVIPVQTYPIYQQNGYTNPSVFQPTNMQNYVQGNRAENQMNVSPFSIREALLNKLFTNPTGQSTLDHSITNYCPYLNGIENYQIPTNLVNNYPIGSAFYLTNDTSNINIEKNAVDIKIEESSKQQKRKSKRKRKDNDEEMIAMKRRNGLATNGEISQELRKDDNENVINNNKKGRRKKKEKPTLEENITENDKKGVESMKKRRYHKKHKKSSVKSELKNEFNEESKSVNMEDTLNVVLTNEGKGAEHRHTRNSNPKTNELPKSIPRTPEEITNQYFSNLHQYSDLDITNWFNNYKSFYESLLAKQPVTKNNKRKHKRKRKFRKGKKKHQKNISCTKNVVEAPTITNTDKVTNDSTTTESMMYWSEQIETNFNSNLANENSKSLEENEKDLKYSSNEIFKDENESTYEYEEKYKNGFYGGYIDDYYPQFFDSGDFNANNEEFILNKLNNNKYYYVTEKIDTGFTNEQEIEYDGISSQWFKDYNEDDGSSIVDSKIAIDNIEETKFRSPPLLETPDFLTRHIDKSEIGSSLNNNNFDDISERFVGDKSSPYSRAKSSNIAGSKRNEINEQQKNIETSYAKSKVASYGPVYIPENTAVTADKNYHSDTQSFEGTTYQNNDGIMYIIAESLDDPDLYW